MSVEFKPDSQEEAMANKKHEMVEQIKVKFSQIIHLCEDDILDPTHVLQKLKEIADERTEQYPKHAMW